MGKHLRIVGSHPNGDNPRAQDNVWQLRLSYLRDRFQIAAPEGFSARRSAPAHTTSEVAVREPGVLVSIIAFNDQLAQIMP